MKKTILAVMVCALLVFSGSAWSFYTIGVSPNPVINVGAIDTFLDAETLGNSGDDTELAWVNTYLASIIPNFTPYTSMVKEDVASGSWVPTVENPKVYAAGFNSFQPEFFFVKVGNTDTGTHFLFKNVQELGWAVVDLAASGVDIKNIGKFSHTGELGGTPVPVPPTVWLLGSGLVGLVGLRRRFFRK